MADEPTPEPGPTPPAGDKDKPGEPARLPDDHPLVKAYRATQARLRDREDAEKSELQKAQDALADRDKQLADLPKSVRSQAIRFASIAGAKGFIDPEDALLGIGDTDLSDEAAVTAALDALAERKPHLVRQEPAKRRTAERPKPKTGDSGDGGDDGDLKGKERAAAALRDFRRTR